MKAFKNKKFLVVGLARSGVGAANLLVRLGADVYITDSKPLRSLEDRTRKLLPDVRTVEEDAAGALIDSIDVIVISPGVPLNVPLLIKARTKGTPVIGEFELAYQAAASSELRNSSLAENEKQEVHNRELAAPTFIGVTGTNGKSTTTTLIDLMLKASGRRTLLGGNIGNALTEELMNAEAGEDRFDYIVAEISSFQLETIRDFRPRIALVLNMTPDHLDRYSGMVDYMDAKARIFENQNSEDYLIANADDPAVMKMIHEKLEAGRVNPPKILFFSRSREVEGLYYKDGIIYCNLSVHALGKGGHADRSACFKLISTKEIKIKGAHNIENAMAASLAALISGCTPQDISTVLTSFPGLEHRIEFAGEVRGVTFINDSKGTNVGAVAKSLEDFEKVILIMGGLDKGSDFSVLRDLIKIKVKLLVLIGKAKDVIAEAVGPVTEICKTSGLREAVETAMNRASAGDVVMLSPGCASFDMFKDFEDRGRKFKEAVRALQG